MSVANPPKPGPSAQEAVASLLLETPRRDLLVDAWYRLIRNKASVFGMVIIGVFTILALFANFIAPHNPLQINSGKNYLPPTFIGTSQSGKVANPDFLLGTDTLGRDVLSRVIYGARVSMLVGFLPTTIILVVGTFIGMVSGYIGGKMDNLLMRITDVVFAFPDLLFFIIVMISLRDTLLGQLMNG